MRKKFRGSLSGEQLNTILAADPGYQKHKAVFDAELSAKLERLALAEAPLVQALRDAGFQVSSVWDFVKQPPTVYTSIAHRFGTLAT